MKTKKLLVFGLGLFVSLATFLFVADGQAFAATKTWTGGGSDDNWSTSGNWSPSGAPSNGDDLVFTLNGSSLGGTNDISGLSIKTITASGTSNGLFDTDDPLTITESIINTGTHKAIELGAALTLGGNVTVRGIGFNSGAGSIALNGNTLTVLDASPANDHMIFGVSVPITGNGGVTINAPNTNIQFGAVNTYSGTTTILANDGLLFSTGSGATPLNAFGSSSIIIGPDASISADFAGVSSGATWSNPITIQQSSVGNNFWDFSINFQSIYFYGVTGTINVPNITLQGSTRFGAGLGVTVNLAGITANGHCIEYGRNNWTASQFQNGPAACVVTPAGPATPDTGFEKVTKNPLIALSVSVLSAGAVIVLARRYAASH